MDPEVYEPPVVSDVSLEMATIGDVFFVGVDREVPADYHEVDGSVLDSRLYPEFARAMDIVTPTFTLPTPVRMREGIKPIIKMGRKNQPSPPSEIPPELAAARRQRVERKREHVERERDLRRSARRRDSSGDH